jgi:hypothetical protein
MDTKADLFNPLQYLPNEDDPWKDPARRWRRCQYLLEHHRRPNSSKDDVVTWEAWRYLQDLARCRDDADRKQVAGDFPAVAEAHHLFTVAEPMRRAEVEARLLAQESDEEVADKCCLSPAGVACYHEVFFNVRPYLETRGYIVNVVLGSKVHYGMTPDDRELLLKMYGYYMGPLMVDELLDYWSDPPVVPESFAALDDTELAILQRKLQLHALILAQTLPVDDLTPAGHQVLHDLMAAHLQTPTTVSDGQPPALSAVRSILDDVVRLSQVTREARREVVPA